MREHKPSIDADANVNADASGAARSPSRMWCTPIDEDGRRTIDADADVGAGTS